ncbi:hypothetical protein Hdeb2414_s0008g00296831 [Helianthus debilis subsp. tardiflorus]
MKNSKLDPYDRKASVMTSDFSPEGPGDFGFAFNDSNFSDRVLHIEIVSEPVDSAHDGDGCASLSDWARNRKRRREDIKKETAVDIAAGYPEEQLLYQPDHLPDDDVDAENPDEEPAEMVEEAPSDDNDSNGAMECSTVVRVIVIDSE